MWKDTGPTSLYAGPSELGLESGASRGQNTGTLKGIDHKTQN